jgi:hypothetical protein
MPIGLMVGVEAGISTLANNLELLEYVIMNEGLLGFLHGDVDPTCVITCLDGRHRVCRLALSAIVLCVKALDPVGQQPCLPHCPTFWDSS